MRRAVRPAPSQRHSGSRAATVSIRASEDTRNRTDHAVRHGPRPRPVGHGANTFATYKEIINMETIVSLYAYLITLLSIFIIGLTILPLLVRFDNHRRAQHNRELLIKDLRQMISALQQQVPHLTEVVQSHYFQQLMPVIELQPLLPPGIREAFEQHWNIYAQHCEQIMMLGITAQGSEESGCYAPRLIQASIQMLDCLMKSAHPHAPGSSKTLSSELRPPSHAAGSLRSQR